jgi:heptosyltransferase II
MKILVVGPSWVGDMMMSQSLYRTLLTCFPDARIDVMAPNWCRPLLARMPEVHQAIAMPIGHGSFAFWERRKLGQQLRTAEYDRAYVLPNSFKSALIPFFANIPKRIGWRGEMRYGLLNDARVLDKQAFPLMVERYVALAFAKESVKSAQELPRPLLTPKLSVTSAETLGMKTQFGLSEIRPIIGFCPGAEFGPAKRWPHYHYTTLATMLIERGFDIILLGSKSDQQTGQTILEALPADLQAHCQNLAGTTTLEQAVTLIAGCQAIVSNDSGLMHIAAALDRPLVALYGPSSPDFTPPLSDKAEVIRLISGYLKIRKGDQQLGYHQSLIDITPKSVNDALSQLIIAKQES